MNMERTLLMIGLAKVTITTRPKDTNKDTSTNINANINIQNTDH